MTLSKTKFAGLATLVLGIAVAALMFGYSIAQAGITYSQPTQESSYLDHTFFVATTTTATSTNQNSVDRVVRIDGATNVLFFFGRGDTKGTGNSGSTNFKVEVSRDGIEWFSYNTLLQNSATSTYPTTLSSVTLAGTSSVATYMQYNGWHFARCIAVETTDGEHTCRASVTY